MAMMLSATSLTVSLDPMSLISTSEGVGDTWNTQHVTIDEILGRVMSHRREGVIEHMIHRGCDLHQK